MQQKGLTVITEIIPDQISPLRQLLEEIGNDINHNVHIDFSRLKTVHFISWIILGEDESTGEKIPAKLVLSTNFEGHVKPHLKELAEKAGPGLRSIYQHCLNFPQNASSQEIVNYLFSKQCKNAAFYNGTMGRSVEQVENENKFYYHIQDYLMRSNPSQNWKGKTTDNLCGDIKSSALDKEEYKWAQNKYPRPFLQQFGPLLLATGLIAIISLAAIAWTFIWLPMLIFTLALIVPVTIWWTSVRNLEKKDAKDFSPAIQSIDQLSQLTLKEDFKIQNQITHLVKIKPGRTRQITLKLLLGAINLLARTFYNKGNLAGIVTIHFARWVIIDNGKRLLFMSNYDGNWESYLGEFVDRAATGLTGVWSNCEDYPPSKNLVGQGAKYSKEFKSWARQKQIPTQVWYSARKTLSVQNVFNNAEIRMGFTQKLKGEKASKWLLKL